ncbi:MAG: Fe-S protein assembly co-chaperone HscB [Saprospiraceae bacterium]|nr:Fe-S protein assembly co-chaperone HscB [Saprospiraceae bacterium]
MDYFEFYGISPSFRPDEALLRRTYLERSRQYHPDFHTLSDDAEQARMLEMATLNNEAFKTLSDPDKRMAYILKINGLLEEGESQGALPQAFLMDMMDINEAMMELEFDFDAERLQQTQQAVETLDQSMKQDIQPVLDNWTPTAANAASDLMRVREYFFKNRYLLRIFENLSKFAAASGN